MANIFTSQCIPSTYNSRVGTCNKKFIFNIFSLLSFKTVSEESVIKSNLPAQNWLNWLKIKKKNANCNMIYSKGNFHNGFFQALSKDTLTYINHDKTWYVYFTWHYVFILFITIPNVTILIIIILYVIVPKNLMF